VLDVGFGLGGTGETFGRELRGASLTGIDVAPGPLALARRRVAGTGENSIEFVEGDATRTRFPSAGFDRVLATESLLYMSRLRFLREAARLLDEAGRLVAAEFLLAGPSVPRRLPVLLTESRHLGFIGRSHVPITVGAYRALARFAGLVLVGAEDITASTLPTYEALRAVIDEQGWPDSANRAIDAIERMSTTGIVRYTLLTFEPRRRRR
ncbi:MAG: class I SAM-dependent methyltransferase, partial [Solirubrobacterales bacterium]